MNGKTSCSSRWYVSSLQVNAKEAANAIREHWRVESQLHWVLDVVFREDALKVTDPDGAKHLALFNRAGTRSDNIKAKKTVWQVSVVVQVGAPHFAQNCCLVNMSPKWNPALGNKRIL